MIPYPEIDPVAFSLGPFDVRWYALAYLAGFLGGWQYALYLTRLFNDGPHKQVIDDFIPWAVLGVILGGRAGYVLFYQPGYYFEYPIEILKVWAGGMAFHGGLLGAMIAVVAFAYVRRIAILRMGDIVACCVPIGIFFGRIANFINGELYGRPSSLPWSMVFPMGGDVPRHPSQIYEALLEGLLLFVILGWTVHRRAVRERPGMVAGLFLGLYGVFRFGAEFFRAPDPQIGLVYDALTMGQILSVPMILAGIGIMIYVWQHGPGRRGDVR